MEAKAERKAEPAEWPRYPEVADHQRSFLRRFAGALVLDASVYEEVEQDPKALVQAAVVVALGGLARGMAAFADEGAASLVGSLLLGLGLWPACAALVWIVGVRFFGYPSRYREVLQALGFAAAPLVLLALGTLPGEALRTFWWLLGHGMAVLALIVAVREALYVTRAQALLVCCIALAISLGGLFVLGLLVFGGEAL